jgi:hypothetical protein
LATTTRLLVDPAHLAEFFDPAAGNALRTGPGGAPLLASLQQVLAKAHASPSNQMSYVDKLFSLAPLAMGVMTTGVTSLGRRTVRSLIAEFVARYTDPVLAGALQSVDNVAEGLMEFLSERYAKACAHEHQRPELELILGGYTPQSDAPEVRRLNVAQRSIEHPLTGDGYGVVFGGQVDWIQRIVFGTDEANKWAIALRCMAAVETYRGAAEAHLRAAGVDGVVLPDPRVALNPLTPFDDWDLEGLDAEWGDFSEQNAVDCVDFFVDVMIKCQQFSHRLSTVGGPVRIGIIRPTGFQFVSREALRHRGNAVPASGI